MKNRKLTASLLISAAAATLSWRPQSASAASATWDGGGADNFTNTAANWVGNVAPSSNDLLTFAGSTRPTPSNNLTAGTQFSGIGFGATAAAFTLSGNGIMLGTNGGVASNSSNLQTVNLPVTLAYGNHRFDGGVSELALNPPGGLVRNAGSAAQFQGSVNTTTIANDSTGILGAWATVGTDWAARSGSQIVAYSGYTDLPNNPTISNSPGANLRWNNATNGTLTSGVTDINTLNFTTPHFNEVTLNIPLDGTLRLGASGGIFRSSHELDSFYFFIGRRDFGSVSFPTGTLTAGGANNAPGELVLGANRGQMLVSSTIANNGTGAVTLVNAGDGEVLMFFSNSYTGGTYVNSGTLRAIDTNGFGTGPVYVASGGRANCDNYNGGGIVSNEFYIAGIGAGTSNASNGALGLSRDNVVASGTIHLVADARITMPFATTMSIGSKITGKITGNAALELGGSDTMGFLTLTNPANDWTGNTTFRRGEVRIGGSGEVIPNGAGKGDVFFSDPVVRVDLNGHTETINGLNGGADELDINTFSSRVAGPAKLIVGGNNANGSFGGTIENGSGVVSLTKIGAGQQILFGENTYTGVTTVQGGRLVLGNDGTRNAWHPALENVGGADVQSGRLVFDYNGSSSPAAQVQLILTTAYASGFASGQIRSSTADASHGLGWADETVAKQVTVMYTFYGDADLNGSVDTVDFNLLAASFSQSGKVWAKGDFNYDTTVDTIDFNLLAANFSKSLPGAASLGPPVPEPSCVGIFVLAAMSLGWRGRRIRR